MFRVLVENDEVVERTGEKNGRPWRMIHQVLWIYLYDESGTEKAHPVELKHQLRTARNQGESDEKPFPVGEYRLPLNAIYINKYKELSISLRSLQPHSPKTVKAVGAK